MKSIKTLIKNLFNPQNSDNTYSTTDRFFSFLNTNTITSRNAQQIADVFGCVNIKANALAVMPLKLYRKTQNGKVDAIDNTLYNLLKYEPNPNLTAYEWKKMISQDLDLRGNHFVQIIKDNLLNVVALYPLQADLMTVEFVKVGDSIEKLFKYNNQIVPANRILHFMDIPDHQGLKGISRIEYNRQTLDFSNNASSFGNRLFKNSATPSGAFEHSTSLSDEAYKRLKESLENQYSGLENSGKPLLLEDGLKFTPISITSSDAQWLESRKYNRENIATIFGVPSSMLNDTANTAYSNLEQKYLEFQTNTILPITIAVEEKLRQKLLSKSEKQYLIIKFVFNSLMRADAKSRAEFYRTMFNIASLSPNEIREFEDMNSYTGGEQYFMQTANSTVEKIVKIEEVK